MLLKQTEEEDTNPNLRLLLHQKTAAFWDNAKHESETGNDIYVLGALQGIVCMLSWISQLSSFLLVVVAAFFFLCCFKK